MSERCRHVDAKCVDCGLMLYRPGREAARAVQDDGPTDCREGHDFRLTTDFDGEPVRCGRCKCLPVAVQDDGLDVERLALAWWVGIQHRNGLTEEQAVARWHDGDRDTEHMRGVYLDVAQHALAHLRTASPLNASGDER